jgi:Sensors of blue-light using FAD
MERRDSGAAGSDRKAERDLVRLVYVSVAAPGLAAGDLEAIAAGSAARNRAAGLTGLLLHQGGGFYGVLEGPRRRLLARMERIVTDRRHGRIDVLLEAPAAERRFETWTFGSLPTLDDAAMRPPPADDFIRSLGRRLK